MLHRAGGGSMISPMASAPPGPGRTKTALLVDGDAMFRSGVRRLLDEGGLSVAGEAENASDVIALCRELSPDIVLMALRLRGTSGIEATRRICERTPERRVVLIGAATDAKMAEEALRAGARGFLLKDDPPEQILAALGAALDGGLPISPTAAAELLGHLREPHPDGRPRRGELTERERSVLRLLAAGRSNSQIAVELSISDSTV